MRILGHRPQRTLRTTVEVSGTGFLTGEHVTLRLVPAPEDHGVIFHRTDLPGLPAIPAHVRHVTGTSRRTTLGHAPREVGLVEHVLSALGGMRVDNCLVEVDAPEAPGMDGSAGAFTEAIIRAGVLKQSGSRPIMGVDRMTCIRAGNATLTASTVGGTVGDLLKGNATWRVA